MELAQNLSRAQLAFQVKGTSLDDFLVLRYRGREGLCQLYRFEIELASTAQTVPDFGTIVGKPATLSVNSPYGTRWFHGIVSRFEMTGETVDQSYYVAEVVPTVWLLTHRYGSRIFQKKTTKEIIAQVLEEGGIAPDRVDTGGLEKSYQPREFCVQYRETDYNFICRLMEDEGIRWYFEQTKDAHILKLADSGDYKPMAGETKLPYHAPTALNVHKEHVYQFRMGRSVRPGAVVLTDFSFDKPPLDLQATADSGRDKTLEYSDFPGGYATQGDGKKIAKMRAEEFESGRLTAAGMSNSPRLAVGRKFELTDHPGSLPNQAYVVSSLVHHGKQSTSRTTNSTNSNGNGRITNRFHSRGAPWLFHGGRVSSDVARVAASLGADPVRAIGSAPLLNGNGTNSKTSDQSVSYDCHFECMPADVTYRPPRITPWPVVRGSQTARIVGPSGEEIHTDELGRVKVQFHWDREGKFDNKSSCWIRVSQGMAGGNYGMMFLPRVGQEVVVDFLEGDPDKPLITGRVYNADHMPPYPLPDEKTKSVIKTRSSAGGGGANELRFEDAKGKEQILLHGQKDIHLRAKNDLIRTIENDSHLKVDHDRIEYVKNDSSLIVDEGNKIEEIGGDKSSLVKGKQSTKIEGTCSTHVLKDVVHQFDANHKHDVAKTYTTIAKDIKLEASGKIELKCGDSSIIITPGEDTVLIGDSGGGGSSKARKPGAGKKKKKKKKEEEEEDNVEDAADEESADEVANDRAAADSSEHTAGDSDTKQPGEPVQKVDDGTHWIEIELIGEDDEGVPGERYTVRLLDGKEVCGALDGKGQARIEGIKQPGWCRVSFPKLDMHVWQDYTAR